MAKEHQGFERARSLLRIWARSVICDFAVGFSNEDGRLPVKKLGSRAPWPGVAVFSHGDSSSLRLVQVTVFFFPNLQGVGDLAWGPISAWRLRARGFGWLGPKRLWATIWGGSMAWRRGLWGY